MRAPDIDATRKKNPVLGFRAFASEEGVVRGRTSTRQESFECIRLRRCGSCELSAARVDAPPLRLEARVGPITS